MIDVNDPQVRALFVGLLAVERLIAYSEGVYRLRGKADCTTAWSDLRRGGRWPEWLDLFDRALITAKDICEPP